MADRWYETFFHGVALDFWRAAVSDELTTGESSFIRKHLKVGEGAKLLDVPCGNGRLSLALARDGFRLTGVDIASEFIDEAKAKAAKLGFDVDWRNGDMRDLPGSSEFDGAFCFGNSFGYLEDEGNEEFLKSVSRALRPGSRFILDAPAVAECLLPSLKDERAMEIGGITLAADSRYDPAQGRLFTDYTFIRDGISDTRPSSQRIYPYRELVALLDQAGLKVSQSYAGLDEGPFELGSPRLLLVSVKAE